MSVFLNVEKQDSNGYTIGFIFGTFEECFDFIKTLSACSRQYLAFRIEESAEG